MRLLAARRPFSSPICRGWVHALALFACVSVVAGCQAPLKTNDWSTYDGPGAEHFQKEEISFPVISDPLEPINRGVGVFNHGLMMGFVRPVSAVYRFFVPAVARKGVQNVFNNLYYPVRLVGNLLQAKWGGAGRETERFVVNSTIGVLGLWDTASALEIEPSNEDFGQTFGRWGWRNSTYLNLPVLGPSTIRDGLGQIGNAAADPLTYLTGATTVRSAVRLADGFPTYRSFVETNFDPYELGRLLFVLYQELRIDDYAYSTIADDTGETETLQSVFLTNEDPDFPEKGRTHKVRLPTTGKKLPYTVYLQPEPSPILFFIPGTGGHRLGGSSLGIAEISYGNGNSVVTISNVFNHEFLELASSTGMPGFAPVDSHDVHVAMDAIHKDLERRYPGRFTTRGLGGLSLGAMITLYIAAEEQNPDNELVTFDVYIAVNSPVSLKHSVEQLDAFYNAPLAYPAEVRKQRTASILRKVLDLAEGGGLRPGDKLPFTRTESEFLIGLSFRNTLRDIIYQSQQRHDLGVLKTEGGNWTRAVPYQEILQFSFMEYMYAFALPYYAETRDDVEFTEAGADRVFERCDLRSIGDQLARNPKIRFITNRNDFLLRAQDIEWISQLLGPERVVFFESGGHLGNLYRDDIQKAIRRFVQTAWDRE